MSFRRWGSNRSGSGRMVSGAVRLGAVLSLVGGILMIVLALIGTLGMVGFTSLFRGVPTLYTFGSGLLAGTGLLVGLIGGILSIIGSRRPYSLVWGIVLLVIGLVVGGWGGLLVLVGAIIAIVASHV